MGLAEGDIQLVATDHSPAPPALKRIEEGDFVRAWGGIASLQIGLAATWTGAAARGVEVTHLARWCATAPAALAGLDATKGSIAVGRDADFVVWDPDGETNVVPSALYHRHPVTPYAGRKLQGRVLTTILRGEVVYQDGTCGALARGMLLARPGTSAVQSHR
jgi:allantoinase